MVEIFLKLQKSTKIVSTKIQFFDQNSKISEIDVQSKMVGAGSLRSPGMVFVCLLCEQAHFDRQKLYLLASGVVCELARFARQDIQTDHSACNLSYCADEAIMFFQTLRRTTLCLNSRSRKMATFF